MDVGAVIDDAMRESRKLERSKIAKWEKLAERIKALSLEEAEELSDVLILRRSDWLVVPKDRLFEIMEKVGMNTELDQSVD